MKETDFFVFAAKKKIQTNKKKSLKKSHWKIKEKKKVVIVLIRMWRGVEVIGGVKLVYILKVTIICCKKKP